MNLSSGRKLATATVLSLLSFSVTFISSIYSSAIVPIALSFHVSTEVSTLGISLYILGFGLGPVIFGPLSERFGRTLPLFSGTSPSASCRFPSLWHKTFKQSCSSAFLGGTSGSSALTIVAGIVADIYGPVQRGLAVAVFSSTVSFGPAMGPVVGSFITESYLGWRWTGYVSFMLSIFSWILGVLVVPETYGPVLLQRRAKRLRHQTRIGPSTQRWTNNRSPSTAWWSGSLLDHSSCSSGNPYFRRSPCISPWCTEFCTCSLRHSLSPSTSSGDGSLRLHRSHSFLSELASSLTVSSLL
ncbi:hypothetical protein G647_07374 [Cladophialophora carrionii CBS 160.54]|uniref:Major facilitator superfamily (MFS) profile domain-containing protein n=1 Tax=Cladophialophora carrionii CBS 160.54 TaxID=1279043 RepID=V9D312_9EURO|nr:uncharacterized protein G647_07374 [Cladophialophora carrionii CBS 160.54]ETI21031.1 hypothetical protein G647_07374 [Cladophialophora carrionii CBS 160.54]